MRNYSDPQYKDWRKKVYARDKYTCQWPDCNSKYKIQAHHIYKWSEFPGLRYHLNNGISLCVYHHQQITRNEDAYIELFMRILAEKNKK